MRRLQSIINKNKRKVFESLPYILLIMANFIYMYANGLGAVDFQQILYNFFLFLIVAIFIFIKISLLLHRWFVEDQGQVKEKTKKIIQKIMQSYTFFMSLFAKDNEKMMIKIVFLIQLWGLINYVLPSMLLYLIVAAYYQFEGYIYGKFKAQIAQFQLINEEFIQYVLQKIPRYQQQSSNKNE